MVLLQASVIGVIGYGLGLALAAAFFDFAPPASAALRGFYLPDFVAVGMAGMVVVIMLAATLFSLRRVLTIDPAVVFRG
jgi:putative ABC transport system permease protein